MNSLDQQASRHQSLFNQNWQFQLNETPQESAWEEIQLPHDWSIKQDFNPECDGATGYLPGGIGWYRKSFDNPLSHSQRKAFLVFDGIYNHATIRLNQQELHYQAYGYSPFVLDITDYLQANNQLEIQVDRRRYIDSRWYTGSGIYRNVELITTQDIYIPIWENQLRSTVIDANTALIQQSLQLQNDQPENVALKIETNIFWENNLVANEQQQVTLAQGSHSVILDIPLNTPKLWSPSSPSLYQVQTRVYQGNTIVDEVQTSIGIRDFHFCADTGFYLNGQSMKIKGVCLHHDGGLVGAAVPREVWVRRLTKLKKAGVNAIRIAHNPASVELLELCDQLGFLVQDEFFDEWDYPKDKRLNMGNQHDDFESQGYSFDFQINAERDLKNTLKSHFNHPCIFMWSIGNEIEWTYPRNVQATGFFDAKWDGNYFWSLPPHTPQEIKQALTDLPQHQYDIGQTANKLAQWVKELDTTRPVTANCILPSASYLSGYADALDVIGFSYRRVVYDYGHENYPNLPIIGNENLPQWHEWKAVLDRPHVAGLFLWTGINYMGESHNQWPTRTTNSGLLDAAGFEKQSYYLFQSLWTEQPMVHISTQQASKTDFVLDPSTFSAKATDPDAWKQALWVWEERHQHWNYSQDEWIIVEVLSNCEQVELWLNDRCIGQQSLLEQEDRFFRWALPYHSGQLIAKGINEGQIVTQEFISTSNEATQVQILDESTHNSNLKQLIIQLADQDNNPVRHQERNIKLSTTCGKIIGVDNGSASSTQPHKIHTSKEQSITTHQGRVLVIIEMEATHSNLELIVELDGIKTTLFL